MNGGFDAAAFLTSTARFRKKKSKKPPEPAKKLDISGPRDFRHVIHLDRQDVGYVQHLAKHPRGDVPFSAATLPNMNRDSEMYDEIDNNRLDGMSEISPTPRLVKDRTRSADHRMDNSVVRTMPRMPDFAQSCAALPTVGTRSSLDQTIPITEEADFLWAKKQKERPALPAQWKGTSQSGLGKGKSLTSLNNCGINNQSSSPLPYIYPMGIQKKESFLTNPSNYGTWESSTSGQQIVNEEYILQGTLDRYRNMKTAQSSPAGPGPVQRKTTRSSDYGTSNSSVFGTGRLILNPDYIRADQLSQSKIKNRTESCDEGVGLNRGGSTTGKFEKKAAVHGSAQRHQHQKLNIPAPPRCNTPSPPRNEAPPRPNLKLNTPPSVPPRGQTPVGWTGPTLAESWSSSFVPMRNPPKDVFSLHRKNKISPAHGETPIYMGSPSPVSDTITTVHFEDLTIHHNATYFLYQKGTSRSSVASISPLRGETSTFPPHNDEEEESSVTRL